MANVIIHLQDHEPATLNDLAGWVCNTSKAQAALIIRREPQWLGIIPGEVPIQMHQGTALSGIDGELDSKGG